MDYIIMDTFLAIVSSSNAKEVNIDAEELVHFVCKTTIWNGASIYQMDYDNSPSEMQGELLVLYYWFMSLTRSDKGFSFYFLLYRYWLSDAYILFYASFLV